MSDGHLAVHLQGYTCFCYRHQALIIDGHSTAEHSNRSCEYKFEKKILKIYNNEWILPPPSLKRYTVGQNLNKSCGLCM